MNEHDELPVNLAALAAPSAHLDRLVGEVVTSLPPRDSPARQAMTWGVPVAVAATALLMVDAARRPEPVPNVLPLTAPAPVVRYISGDSTVTMRELLAGTANGGDR